MKRLSLLATLFSIEPVRADLVDVDTAKRVCINDKNTCKYVTNMCFSHTATLLCEQRLVLHCGIGLAGNLLGCCDAWTQ